MCALLIVFSVHRIHCTKQIVFCLDDIILSWDSMETEMDLKKEGDSHYKIEISFFLMTCNY